MKYNDENLDSSITETSPERKHSFFNWENILKIIIAFAAIYFFIMLFFASKYNISYDLLEYIIGDNIPFSNIEYEIPLRDIVTICDGIDVDILILTISIIITVITFLLKKIVESLVYAIFIYWLISFLVYIAYILPLKYDNRQNTGNPYIVNTDITRVYHGSKSSGIYFVYDGREIHINRYLKGLEKAPNKKISLVIRDGSRGLPIIDDYKIFYNNEINELDMPETVEEFYNGIKDSLGIYIKERMPQINSNKYSSVTASFSVTEKGDVQDVKLTKGMLHSVDSSLIKAINDMGKWKGRRIKGSANVRIQIDYNDGRVFYMIVKVFIKGKDYFYTDNYYLLRGNTSDLYDGRKYDNYYPLE